MRDYLALGDGISLRPWTATDAPAVLEAFTEPDMRAQSATPIASAAAAARWVQARAEQWESGTGYGFAAVDESDCLLAAVTVSAIDRRHRIGWVSYWTTAPARGKGVATSACRGLAEWAFADLGLFRLELGHRTNNPASCRVAQRAGFIAEGMERQKLEYDGVRYDVELHARLATDPMG